MIRELSDTDLVARLRQTNADGKQEILLLLYDRYKSLVLKVCYHYLRDYEQANDVFHDVFVKVIEKAETLNNPAVFKSWLMTITRNLCVDVLRKSSYLKGQVPLDPQIEVSSDDREEIRLIAELDKQKLIGQLSECIRRLDTFQMSVFKLRWKGLKSAQIQKMVQTDDKELRRAYDKIKNTLEPCMKRKGFIVSIDQIISLGEIDE
jgi:RNA polymerase sigma-70 factor (ECF subfamily)